MLINIEVERIRHQMCQEDLARHVGVTTRTYGNWIQGKTDIPAKKLYKFSKLFNKSMEHLLNGGEEEKG